MREATPARPILLFDEEDKVIKVIARLLAVLTVAASGLLYVRIRCPVGPLKGTLWILRLLTEAVTPFIALAGAAAAGLALLARSPMALLTGLLGALTAAQSGFAQAFGADSERAIMPEQKAGMLRRRWTWHLPEAPEARW